MPQSRQGFVQACNNGAKAEVIKFNNTNNQKLMEIVLISHCLWGESEKLSRRQLVKTSMLHWRPVYEKRLAFYLCNFIPIDVT